MSPRRNRRSRFWIGIGTIFMTALALGIGLYASNAFAGAPSNVPAIMPASSGNNQQQVKPQAGQNKFEAAPGGRKLLQKANPNAPDVPVNYVLDDGTDENSIGFGTTTTETAAIWLNRFTPGAGAYPITLTSIQVLWPSQSTVTNTNELIGKTVRLLVYNDADGNNDPSNATLVSIVTSTIIVTDVFQTYTVSITIPGPTGDIYVGFEDYWAEPNGFVPRLFPAAIDQTPPSQRRSWVAGGGTVPDINNLGNNATLAIIDDQGLPGNWLIRASGTDSFLLSPTPTNTPTVTLTPTVTNTPQSCGPGSGYQVGQTTGASIDPGTTNIGNNCDDCITTITLPFTYNLYGIPHTTANISSNGNMQFVSSNSDFANVCLPDVNFDQTIFAHWDDLCTTDCNATVCPTCGVFTKVVGSTPNRIFNIEWRTIYFNSTTSANFEVRLYEGQDKFEIIYGTGVQGGVGATVGVQRGTGPQMTQFECNSGGLSSGLQLTFQELACGAPTSTPTSTPCGVPAGWSAGPTPPAVGIVRAEGVWFAANSKFYVMGGRTSDTAGSDLLNPREFTPGSPGTWATKAAAFSNNQVNNMVCGPLTRAGTPYIYCVGGSAAGATVSTSDVREYNPVADTMTVVATDPWPGNLKAGNILPGGRAVLNNKLYVIGGFVISPGAMTNEIWEYDPNGTAGARWTQKTATLPVALGYVPAVGIGSFIYTGGGSTFTGGTLADSTFAYRYDPVADVISDTAVPDLPAPGTGETRAVDQGGRVWVLGGGRTAPNPSANVLIFDPANPGAGWTFGTPFLVARRNFAMDAQPGVGIYLIGGYAPTAATNNMQIYSKGVPCPPTVTPTNTPSPTPTPGGIINGHLTWNGLSQPNTRNIGLTATVTLCNAGVPVNFVVTCDTNCNFSLTSGLPDGTYNWRIKGPKHLANTGSLTIVGGVISQEFGKQRAGDSNNTNVVNTTDFNLLKNTLGKTGCPPDPGWDPRNDFNNDCLVNTTDFNLQRNNFGIGGAAANCP